VLNTTQYNNVWSFCVKPRHITVREVSYEHLPKMVRYDAQNFDYRLITG